MRAGCSRWRPRPAAGGCGPARRRSAARRWRSRRARRRRWSWPGRRRRISAEQQAERRPGRPARKPRTRRSKATFMPPPSRPARRCAPPPAASPTGPGDWPRSPPSDGAAGAVEQQLEARRRGRPATGGAWREPAGRAARPHREEGLHDAVFQRMERDDARAARRSSAPARRRRGRPPARPSSSFTAMRSAWNDAGGRMDLGAAAAAQRLLDELGQVQGAGEGLLGAAADDGARRCGGSRAPRRRRRGCGPARPARRSLTRSAAVGPSARHAHVQRPVAHEGEAALGLVELHGRDAEVEDHAVDGGLGRSLRPARRSGARPGGSGRRAGRRRTARPWGRGRRR